MGYKLLIHQIESGAIRMTAAYAINISGSHFVSARFAFGSAKNCLVDRAGYIAGMESVVRLVTARLSKVGIVYLLYSWILMTLTQCH